MSIKHTFFMFARRNILLILILLVLLFVMFPSPIHAKWYLGEERWKEFQKCDEGDLSVGCYSSLMTELFAGNVGCAIMVDPNKDTAKYTPCPMPSSKEEGMDMYRKTAIGHIDTLITATYNYPPASTAYALVDFAHSVGLPGAYAQGLGFGGLAPILPIWKAFRNLTYILFIVFLMILGFMVMFRKKVDPRTVISVQQALPRIIVTLFLITFSYAIAGFLIDIMYLTILIAISVISGALPNLAPTSDLQSLYLTGGWQSVWDGTFGLISTETFLKGLAQIGTAFLFIKGLGNGIAGLVLSALAGGALANLTFSVSPPGVTPVDPVEALLPRFFGGSISPIIYFLIGLGLLFMFIRILFLLINAYVQIIIGIIFGPVHILFDALPTGGGSFSSWIRNITANLIIFPTVVVLMLVGRAINSTIVDNAGAFTGFWSPPLIPAWTPGAIKFVIGFGIVTIIPSIAGALKERLQAKPAIPLGVGAPLAPFLSGAQTALGVGSQFYYFGQTLGMVKGLMPGRNTGQPQRERG